MSQEIYKKGSSYEVGDSLEGGTIRGIWDYPLNSGLLFLMTEQSDGTYTLLTMPKKHIVGPSLARFIPESILGEVASLLETGNKKKAAPSSKPKGLTRQVVLPTDKRTKNVSAKKK